MMGPAGEESRIQALEFLRPALAAVGNEPVRFSAVALDAEGRPVPVQNSDEGFALLFRDLYRVEFFGQRAATRPNRTPRNSGAPRLPPAA